MDFSPSFYSIIKQHLIKHFLSPNQTAVYLYLFNNHWKDLDSWFCKRLTIKSVINCCCSVVLSSSHFTTKWQYFANLVHITAYLPYIGGFASPKTGRILECGHFLNCCDVFLRCDSWFSVFKLSLNLLDFRYLVYGQCWTQHQWIPVLHLHQ